MLKSYTYIYRLSLRDIVYTEGLGAVNASQKRVLLTTTGSQNVYSAHRFYMENGNVFSLNINTK